MGNMKENPRYHIISLRVSDYERELLSEISSKTRRSISSLMREAIRWELFEKSDSRRLCN